MHGISSPTGQYWAGYPSIGACQTIPDLLNKAAETWPHSVVLNFFDEGSQITFAGLHDQVLKVAAALRRLRISRGERVGLQLGNVLEFPVAWLAVIEVGAVVVPINPQSTERELAFLFEDAGIVALICDQEQEGTARTVCRNFAIADERCIVVGEPGLYGFGGLLAEPVTEVTVTDRRIEELVSIQFTSGTTGLPKGCMLTHEYWSRLAQTSLSLMGGKPHRNILGDHPFFYMQNQGYLISALTTGATVHVSRKLSLRRYTGWLHEFNIDFAWIGEELLSLPPSEQDRGHELLFAPADGIDPMHHWELEERFGLKVREWYASTEIGMGVATSWEDAASVGSGSIGYPVSGRETKLIDESLSDIALPAEGELCIRGPGMMLGYWNRDAVNAELFLEGGWFRTGDLVRIDAEGRHFFVGRIKDMIRRSGENIAAAEVEQEINGHPGVAASAVIAVPDAFRGEEVKAIVVRRDPALTAVELRDWCARTLAPFKLPRYVAFRESLPMTASNKISKAALKSEAEDLRQGAYDFVDGVQR